ncbi:GAF domain-containing protein [Chloroflexia bacterium SDU3-3]|nr:GAF domain-containing protein [Chloroflexia bacterium SDU3-3]
MTRKQLFDIEASYFYQPQMFDLAQAQTFDAAVSQAMALLDAICAPRTLQIVWLRHGYHLLGPHHTQALIMPDEAAQLALARGECVLADSSDVFLPLLGRGQLLGWIYLDIPECDTERSLALRMLASQLGPTLALHESAHQEDERVHHFRTLTETGRILSGVLDVETLLATIYTAVCQAVEAPNFYIAFYNPTYDDFELAYVMCEGERLERSYRWPASEGLAGIVIRQRAPLYTNDYMAECARRGVAPRRVSDLPIGLAWLGIPLIANDTVIGMMKVSSLRAGSFYTHDQVDLLAAIGSQAAAALSNARLFRQSTRQSQELEALNRIGRTITSSLDTEQVPSLIMEQVCTLLNVEEGSLLLADEESGDLVFAYTSGPVGNQLLGQRIPRGRGLAGYVVRTGEAVIVNNAQNDTRFYDYTDKSTGFTTKALLAVPLRGVAGIRGVIEVMNRLNGSPFTSDDRRLLEAVADQAVIALENARRFTQVDRALARRAQELSETNAQLQHNLQSLTALNALSMAITTSMRSQHEIFTMTARGVMEVSGAQGALVLLPDDTRLAPVVQLGEAAMSPMVEAVCRTAMRTGRPELVRPLEPDAPLLFAVPMRAPRRLVGMLCVFFLAISPDASDQETVVLFATQAAAAIESIELFAELRGANDLMGSILSSTREGIIMITSDRKIAHANAAIYRLTQLDSQAFQSASFDAWLTNWQRTVSYGLDEWLSLRGGLDRILHGEDRLAFGHLNAQDTQTCSLEWAVLPVHSEEGGVLLVLRDITEAREAERLRQDLTNMIVHDLRTPLSSVMAALEMMLRGIPGDLTDSQRNVLNIASTSSVQMLEMINTLLDISRLEDGRMPITLSATPIASLVKRAVQRVSMLAQERSIIIQTDIPADLPCASADGELIVRVVQNLLGNAIKFSSRGSTVLICVSSYGGGTAHPMLCVSVRDCGIGIAPKDQGRVFAKFSQVGDSRGGTGLGLPFCKLVVEAHGGTIWLESELGHGSSFFFTVPVA